MTRVIIDAFGGDNAPLAVLEGAAKAKELADITLVGDEEKLRREAKAAGISLEGIDLVHAPDVMPMEEEPRAILKAYKDSSMAVGLRLLAEGQGDAFVSAGSTGALLMGATFLVKRIKGVSRPAIATLLPTAKGTPCMLMDAGANAECRPEMLLQFARMGSVYFSRVLGGGKPASVGLVNIGSEEHKGDPLRQETYALLKESDLNFAGNVEAREVPYGAADLLISDGFTGNVLLKAMEGTAGMLMKEIKGLFMRNLRTKIAGLLVKPYVKGLKARMDTREYGGAPVLGVRRPVIKAHGNSDALAVYNAVRVAAEFAAAGVIEAVAEALKGAEEDD